MLSIARASCRAKDGYHLVTVCLPLIVRVETIERSISCISWCDTLRQTR
jgi:hypothetical protein